MSRRKIFRTWTFRVVVIYSLLFAASVLGLLGFIYVTTVGVIDSQINETVLAEMNGLSNSYRDDGLTGLVELIADRIAADRAGNAVYLLTDGEFKPVAGNLPRWPKTPLRQGRWLTFDLEQPDDGGFRPVGEARAISFLLAEGSHLLVGRNLHERQNFRSLIAQSLFWSVFITGVLALVGGVVMSRDMRRRIETINRTTQQIMRGDLQQRVPISGSDDEFDRLSQNLNNMLGKIDHLMSAMREVSDNVAHDLRSPLTRLKTQLEVTLMSAPEPEQYRQTIENAVSETDKILSTFNALLSIAQAEAGTGGAMERTDLAMICADVAELYEPVAEAKGLTLTTALAPAVIIGNRHLLFQVVTNLVDNAIKYGGGSGSVALSLEPLSTSVRVIVADLGQGIPEALRDKVTDRFFRIDPSRTEPGNGLGLSLVSAVMSMHGGKLTLEDNNPGLRAILTLPVLPAIVPPRVTPVDHAVDAELATP